MEIYFNKIKAIFTVGWKQDRKIVGEAELLTDTGKNCELHEEVFTVNQKTLTLSYLIVIDQVKENKGKFASFNIHVDALKHFKEWQGLYLAPQVNSGLPENINSHNSCSMDDTNMTVVLSPKSKAASKSIPLMMALPSSLIKAI